MTKRKFNDDCFEVRVRQKNHLMGQNQSQRLDLKSGACTTRLFTTVIAYYNINNTFVTAILLLLL